MKLRRWGVGLVLITGLMGCSTPEPSAPPPSPSASAAPTSSVDPIHAAICAPGPLPLGEFARAIADARAAYPGVTDERAALALSLVPPALVTGAGLTVTTHPSATTAAAYVQDGALSVPAGSAVAPAEIAYTIFEALARDVMTRGLIADPDMGVDAELMGFVAVTVGLDSYIKVVLTQPELLRGDHLAEVFPFQDAVKRLERSEPHLSQANITKEIFAAAPAYWTALAAYIGPAYYREDPAMPTLYQLHEPVDEGSAARELVGRMRVSC